jgi:RNA polymerase sigma-70 factor, ECF subfamily
MKRGGVMEFEFYAQKRKADLWLDHLMNKYQHMIIRLAYMYVKDIKAAEDIAQETFVKCYIKYDQFNGDSSIKTWICRIAINQCKDYLKSPLRRIGSINLLKKIEIVDTLSPELKVVNSEENEFMVNKILSLPLNYREVIILFYYQELSIKEISEITRTPESTIQTRLSRARAKLKKKLDFE